jgi:hypothetical protein
MTFFVVSGASVALVVIAGIFGMAGRTALALLVSPSLYSLLMTWPYCSTVAGFAWGSCLMNVTSAPLFLLIGPFVDNDKPLPNPYPGILLVAMTIIVVWTVIVFILKRYNKLESRG